MTMGNDFHYTNANSWFVNLDKLIQAFNKNVGYFFFNKFIFKLIKQINIKKKLILGL